MRPGDKILVGKRVFEGKGQRWVRDATVLRSGGRTFSLDFYGAEEFQHFDWDVTVDNATALVEQIFHAPSIPVDCYPKLKEAIRNRFPPTILDDSPVSLVPPRLGQKAQRRFVYCEGLAFIDFANYGEGRIITNSIVKYRVKIGNGFIRAKVKILIKGPYNTNPRYWRGVNSMLPPADPKVRSQMEEEMRRMEEFQQIVKQHLP